MSDLSVMQKHRREFMRSFRNGYWETNDAGLLVMKQQKALFGGAFIHDVNGVDEQIARIDFNLLPNESLDNWLDVHLAAGTQITAWYTALYGGNVSPASTWTAANFDANATEIDDYDEGFRQTWTPGSVSGQSVDNLAAKAAFTISATVTVWGAAILSDNTKSGTAGILLAASKFTSSRDLEDDDVFNIGYTFQAAST